MKVTLRKATAEDSEHILAWRNEISTIPWMGTTRALTRDEHEQWFEKILTDANSLFFIIEVDAEPAGQIRYYLREDGVAKVSINITQHQHGKGIASIAFRQGSAMVRMLGFAEQVMAYVLPENIGSIKAMENAGFVRGEVVDVRGCDHLVMLDNAREIV